MELHYPALGLTAVFTAALTLWRPAWALGVLLAALPFFTRHPSTAAATGFIAIVAVFQCAWLLRRRPRLRAGAAAISGAPLLALALAFAAAALASLTALPLEGMWAEISTAFRMAAPTHWPGLVEGLVRHVEFRREFSVVSALLAVQAMGLAAIVHCETHSSPRVGRQLAFAILIGIAMFVGLGALEFAGMLELTAVRGTAGAVYRPGSIQSTAGNPGWFTECVAYGLPYGLVLLSGRGRPVTRRLALAAWTAGLAVALLLGYQRGGWLTGLVLIGYIAAVAQTVEPERAAGARRARSAASVGLAALIALGLAGAYLVRAQPPTAEIDFAARARSILNGDRLPYWQAAWRIWSLHPVLGGGHESFAYQYRRDFGPGGVFEGTGVKVPDGASAHSIYMQTLTGTGVIGLGLLLAIFGVAAVTAWRVVGVRLDNERRTVALGAAGSLLGVAVYGFAQEVFYVHALRLLCFAGIGLLSGASGGLLTWPPSVSRRLFAALGVAAALHVWYERAWASPERLLAPGVAAGLFEEESNAGHESIRWTTEEAALPLLPGATRVDLDLRSAAPVPQQVTAAACGRQITLELADPAWRRLSLHLGECPAGEHLRLRITPAWRPPGDARLLGVMTRPAVFR